MPAAESGSQSTTKTCINNSANEAARIYQVHTHLTRTPTRNPTRTPTRTPESTPESTPEGSPKRTPKSSDAYSGPLTMSPTPDEPSETEPLHPDARNDLSPYELPEYMLLNPGTPLPAPPTPTTGEALRRPFLCASYNGDSDEENLSQLGSSDWQLQAKDSSDHQNSPTSMAMSKKIIR